MLDGDAGHLIDDTYPRDGEQNMVESTAGGSISGQALCSLGRARLRRLQRRNCASIGQEEDHIEQQRFAAFDEVQTRFPGPHQSGD